MKRPLLLFVALLLFYIPLFGVEEGNANNSIPLVDLYQQDICETLDEVLSPASSPAIIPDLPRVIGEQNNSDQSKKIRADFHDIQGFVLGEVQCPTILNKWANRPILRKSLFILFRNLRI